MSSESEDVNYSLQHQLLTCYQKKEKKKSPFSPSSACVEMKSSPPHLERAFFLGRVREKMAAPWPGNQLYTSTTSSHSQGFRVPPHPAEDKHTLRFLWCWIQCRAVRPEGEGSEAGGGGGAGVQCLVQRGAGTRPGRARPQIPRSRRRPDTCPWLLRELSLKN